MTRARSAQAAFFVTFGLFYSLPAQAAPLVTPISATVTSADDFAAEGFAAIEAAASDMLQGGTSTCTSCSTQSTSSSSALETEVTEFAERAPVVESPTTDDLVNSLCSCEPLVWTFTYRVTIQTTLTQGTLNGRPSTSCPNITRPPNRRDYPSFFVGCYDELTTILDRLVSRATFGPRRERVGTAGCEYTVRQTAAWTFVDGEACRLCGGGCFPLVL